MIIKSKIKNQKSTPIQSGSKQRFHRGFTLIEVVIAVGVFFMLFGFIILNLPSVIRSENVNTTVDTLITDIRSQQVKAMSGAGDGTAGSSFGIYFASDRYVLFRGSVYSPSDTSNFTVNLDPSLNISNVTFPSSVLVFSQASGSAKGYVSGSDTLVVKNLVGIQQKTVRVNRFGTVDQVN